MANLPIRSMARRQIKSKVRCMNVDPVFREASKRTVKKASAAIALAAVAATNITSKAKTTPKPKSKSTKKKVNTKSTSNSKPAQTTSNNEKKLSTTTIKSKSTTSTTKPKATYLEMIQAAIRALADPRGSSRVKIFKWIQSNNNGLMNADSKLMSFRGNMAMKKGLETGLLKNGKSTGMFKIGDKQKLQDKAKSKLTKLAAAVSKTVSKKSASTKKESNLTLTAKKLVKKSSNKKRTVKKSTKNGTKKIKVADITAALNKPKANKTPRLPPKPRVSA